MVGRDTVLFGMLWVAAEEDGSGGWLAVGTLKEDCLMPAAADEGCDPPGPGVKGTVLGLRAMRKWRERRPEGGGCGKEKGVEEGWRAARTRRVECGQQTR